MFNECIWKSDEKLHSFASLISPSKIFFFFEKQYQAFHTVFHHQIKHLAVHQKYSAGRRIFNSLLCVSSGDETLRLMLDILHHTCNQRGAVSGSLGRLLPSRPYTVKRATCTYFFGKSRTSRSFQRPDLMQDRFVFRGW